MKLSRMLSAFYATKILDEFFNETLCIILVAQLCNQKILTNFQVYLCECFYVKLVALLILMLSSVCLRNSHSIFWLPKQSFLCFTYPVFNILNAYTGNCQI